MNKNLSKERSEITLYGHLPYPRVEQAYKEEKKYRKQVPNNSFDLTELYSARAKYTANEKMAAVLAYVMTGSVRGVVRLTGFKQQVISDWKNNSSWWPDAYASIKKEKQEEIDGTMTTIIHAASGELLDRIMNGDEIVTKNGDVVRRKMGGKELAVVMAINYDKRALLRGDPTSRTEKIDQKGLMEELKGEFAKMATEHLDNTVIKTIPNEV